MSIFQSPSAKDFTLQRGFGRTYLDDLANKYIVKPKNAKGIGGFVFDYEGETSSRLQADITDHYVEDNSAVQDHVAKHPTRLSFRGFVAELVQKKQEGLLGAIALLQNKLTTIPALLGKYTPGELQKIQKAVSKATTVVNKVDNALSRVRNIVGFFDTSAPGRTAQERAYRKLQSLWATSQIMVVDTPYGTFGNMVIEEVIFTQSEDTKMWSDITVTLKGMRFVQVQTTSVDNNAARALYQRSPQTDKGSTNGTPQSKSILVQFKDMLFK